MNYIDSYFSRVNHLGTTTAERIKNGGIRSFYKWMAESPHTVNNLFVDRGIYFSAIILTHRDKEYQKIMFLNVSNETQIQVGDILNWTLENGQIEKWILFQKEKKTNGTYQTFWMIRCNYLLKWIDAEGHLQQSWSYLVSSTDDKVKANFRTWHNLITPQANKYAEILMPRYNIERSTNFIVEDESWSVIEYDYTSVPGVIYLSTVENKVNTIYDDLDNDIADLDKKANYSLALPEEPQVFHIGDEVNPIFSILKNGIPISVPTVITSLNQIVVREVNKKLIARAAGEAELQIQLKDFPQIKLNFSISVQDAEKEFLAYIEGPATIKLARKGIYELKSTEELQGDFICSVDKTELATVKIEDNKCVIYANEKNKLGTIQLTITYNNVDYIKSIEIIPLW